MSCMQQTGLVQERKVSPPDLPPRELYRNMGQMLQQVNRGNKFRPTTVKDVTAALAAKNVPKVLPVPDRTALSCSKACFHFG